MNEDCADFRGIEARSDNGGATVIQIDNGKTLMVNPGALYRAAVNQHLG